MISTISTEHNVGVATSTKQIFKRTRHVVAVCRDADLLALVGVGQAKRFQQGPQPN
jgi:hypothetical protein